MDNPSDSLPGNLKELRDHRDWSLNRTACETGVSKAMLGQIERGESSPTIATLWKIATGFNISLSSLLQGRSRNDGPITSLKQDANELRKPISDQDGMLVATLFPYDSKTGFELFELTFPAEYERLSAAHKEGVSEYITVIHGELSILCDEEWVSLKAGQSLRFAGDKPHGYRNSGQVDAVINCLIHYPGYK
ncbi:XRE family transcriptional regulator [Sneathiella sp. P13V-1]|uniref:helix-turn-helix domain-containing protein n=1 Tax=Sneathiella sp. P13V-1 TaxID=2697366 RepID=UPI002AB03670|nr:XRE family transcriptional regulator [Sneathiella sp. P13V-1]